MSKDDKKKKNSKRDQGQHVSPNDLHKKLEEIQTEVDTTAQAAKIPAAAIGGGLLLSLIGVAHTLGQRKAKKQTTIVEVRRE